MESIKKKLKRYKRVLKITNKPSKEEFKQSAKITAIGIFIIGVVGFLLYLLSNILVY